MRIAQDSPRIPKWQHPWDEGHADNIYNRDDRFFSLLIKATLAWLTNNIVMYGKPIKHFILSTGSSYMYVETNGYSYCASEVSGEDQIYMERPRCVVSLSQINIPTEELTQNGIRGSYERLANNEIKGFNAELRRIPVTLQLDLHYVLSTFNEEITLAQEVIDKIMFQKYFSFVYLGQVIEASIAFPQDTRLEVGKVDMTSAETNRNNLDFSITIESNYPCIDEKSESPNDALIAKIIHHTNETKAGDLNIVTDSQTQIITDEVK